MKTLKPLLISGLLGFSAVSSAAPIYNDLGGSTGFGENSFAANDDDSTRIDLSSVFTSGLNFFGTSYNSLFLNNNGNATFGSAMSTFTPTAITGVTDNPMLAPFFADIDTRGGATTADGVGHSMGTNLVYWDLDESAGRFIATWDDVGYYSNHTDLSNAFQLILTKVGDNGDFDIEFRYEDINWTTGDSSSGTNGLGGTVARAGFTSGNGTDFFEIPASGNQDAMLDMEKLSNVGIEGVYRFTVRSGDVSVPAPATLGLFAMGLLGFRLRLKRS